MFCLQILFHQHTFSSTTTSTVWVPEMTLRVTSFSGMLSIAPLITVPNKKCKHSVICLILPLEQCQDNLFQVLAGSVFVMLATILVYVIAKAFKTVEEKCDFMFLFGLFLILVCNLGLIHSLFDDDDILLYPLMVSAMWMFVWIFISTYDIWWILR